MPSETIVSRLFAQAARRPEAPAYHARGDGGWHATCWRDYVAQVRAAAKALMKLGMQEGRTVAIIGFNRPEWVVMDLACMAAGGAPAGIYTSSTETEIQYIAHHAESSVMLVETREQYERVAAVRERLPDLLQVVLMEGCEPVEDASVWSWSEFLSSGAEVSDAELDARVDSLRPDQLATLIYTSGTTGPPKGVMLSHSNLAWTAASCLQLVSFQEGDCSVSYLPLSHIAEQMFSIHAPITVGSSVYFAESIERLPDNLKEVQPTVFFGVPRIWEKIYTKLSAGLEQASGVKAALAGWARGVATRVHTANFEDRALSGWLSFQYRLATKLVFSKLKPRLGLGRGRFLISGAAPLSADVMRFFASLDMPILEVYGQSEDTGPTSFNQPRRARHGTVGPAIPGIEVKIADDDEVIVKGPNVALGYYKDTAATDATFRDGWLHSGDLGEFDADGFLKIIGRKKDLIITAGGKNIAPRDIEEALTAHPLVAQAVLVGDRRPYLVALLTLDDEAAAAYAEERGMSVESLARDTELKASIDEAVERLNAERTRVAGVKRYRLLAKSFTVESGELTPTMKIKRAVVQKKFAAEIEELYGAEVPRA